MNNQPTPIEVILQRGADILHKRETTSHGVSQADRLPLGASALSKCPREIALRASGMQADSPVVKRAIVLQAGEAMHGVLQRWIVAGIKKEDGEATCEYPLRIPIAITPQQQPLLDRALRSIADRGYKGPLPTLRDGHLVLHSTTDVVIVSDEHKVVDVWEIKTMHSFAYKKCKAGGATPEYVSQGKAYALAILLDPRFAGYAVRLSFLFVDRSSGEYVTQHHSTVESEAELRDLMQATQRAANQSIIPALLLLGSQAGTTRVMPPGELNPYPTEQGECQWQCNYCGVGPLRGACYPKATVVEREKNGAPAFSIISINSEDIL